MKIQFSVGILKLAETFVVSWALVYPPEGKAEL